MSTTVESVCVKIAENIGESVMFAGSNMNDIGILRAALSPQNGRLLNALYPERNDGSVSYDKTTNGKCVPKVKVRWLKDSDGGEVKTSRSCSGTTNMATQEEEEIVIDSYVENGFSLGECTINTICDEYDALEGRSAAKSGVSSSVGGSLRNTINNELKTRVQAILKKLNSDGATKLISSIGVNLKYGTSDPQPVKLFNNTDPQKGFLKHFESELRNLSLIHGIPGRPIIITDSYTVLDWFKEVCSISCCSDAGINYANLISQPYELYFSKELTAKLGTGGNIIVVMPETFAFLAVDEFRNLRAALQNSKKIANTTFGQFVITEPSMRVSDSGCIAEVGVPTMPFDLRLIEKDCQGEDAAFGLTFIPSLQYKYIAAPDRGDGVTGIFHFIVDED